MFLPKSIWGVVSLSIILLIFFLSQDLAVEKVLADHCDACQSEVEDWCYDPETDTDYVCGHQCVGDTCPLPQVCNPYEPCQFDDYGSDFCCNNSPNNWTPSPTRNNVCNWEYWWFCNGSGTACDQGPHPLNLNNVTHLCTRLSCGVCIDGQTQTETQYLTSCNSSINGGGCPGIANNCSETVDQQQRTRTCINQCGGWSAWSGWTTVNSYSQCSTSCGTVSDPSSSCYSGHDHKYSCVNNACTHTDDPNGSTDPNCGGSCSAPPPSPPPPPQRYACSGGACVPNPAGPYTVAGCGGACTAPPGGCSVGWTLSNENPPPNSSIQVKVRGLSDPQGWQNIRLTLDGSNTGDLVWPPENPWPTFVYNNVPAKSGGGHTLEFRTNNGSRTCAPSKTFTTVSTTPANLAVSGQPSCALGSYSVTFSWQNTNSTLYLDVAENPQFNGFGNKNVSNLTSTNSSGFTLRPGTTYYWRLWNGSTHTNGPSFFVPACNLTVTKPSCSTGTYTATLNWQGTNSTLWVDIDPDGNWADRFYNKNVGNQTSTSAPAGFNGAVGLSGPMPGLNAGQTYSWRVWNGSEHISGPAFSVPACNTTVTGRMWKDSNGDQVWQSGSEQLIKSGSPSCPESSLPNAFIPEKGVEYTGPVNSTNFPNGCVGPDGPYYATAPLPPGTYNFTVQAPPGWRTYSRTVNLPGDDTDNDRVVHLWWGPNPPPENFSLSPLSCSDAAYSRTLSWQNTTQGVGNLTLQLSDNGFATFSSRDVTTQTSTLLSNLQPSTFYSTRIDNGTGVYATGPSWQIQPCATPWFQVWGDVHSNEAIRAPGGP